MIGALTGTILHLFENKLILDVSGVGYDVFIPRSLPGRLNFKEAEHVRLYIYTHFKENDLRLFGFNDLKSRQLFEMLLTVSGIGPQIALTIIDSIAVEAFYQKIYAGASEDLTRIKGIGKKTAERLIVELKDKIATTVVQLSPSSRPSTSPGFDSTSEDILAALMGLGYGRSEALRALEKVPADKGSVEEKIKAALGLLARL